MRHMRIAVAVLLLFNLLFFGWAKLSDSRPSPTVSAPQLATLKLIPAHGLLPTRCMSLGPFADAAALTAPAAVLTTGGLATRSRKAERTVNSGWWVYIGGQNSRAQRRLAMARLRRSGVTEIAEITFAPGDERISAGIYSDHERAMFTAAKVITARLTPTVEARTSSATDWWLDADIKREVALPAVSTLTTTVPGVAWSECPPSPASG
jgi:hypothetical protein